MAAIFAPRANLIARCSIAAFILFATGAVVFETSFLGSTYYTDVKVEIDQPVPFSHKHHVGGLGIDCRYCHTTVEESAFAGMPATQICMQCHAKLWTHAELLGQVRESWRSGVPIRWRRVNVLPDYVYFNHFIHVSKGIGCASCHGAVDDMPLMRKEATLNMRWCIDCHRHPEREVRPASKVFDVSWKREPEDAATVARRYDAYDIRKESITDCSTCHR